MKITIHYSSWSLLRLLQNEIANFQVQFSFPGRRDSWDNYSYRHLIVYRYSALYYHSINLEVLIRTIESIIFAIIIV